MEKAALTSPQHTTASANRLQQTAGNAAAVAALRSGGAALEALASPIRAAIERDAGRLVRWSSGHFPDRTAIVNTFDDWDNRDRATGGSASPHIDALCEALQAIQLTQVTTGLDAVWYAARSSTTFAQLFDAVLRRSEKYRSYQPGPPLRSALAFDQKRSDALRVLVLAEDYEEASKRLLYVSPSTSRDDVALGLVKYLTDAQLVALTSAPHGRLFSAQLYDELTSGQAGQEEEAQAQRLLVARAAAPGILERFAKATTSAGLMTFPFRKGGITVQSAIPFAHFTATGRIHVKIAANVRFANAFRRDWETLPMAVFVGGLDLDPDEIVGVRMYDEGGTVERVPALRLIALSNLGVTHTMTKIAEVAGYGLGGLGSVGAKAGLAAKTLLWVDRAALVVGALASVISEHRGWIIQRFGPRGRAFVDAVETVNSAIAIFGVARVAIELPTLVLRLGAGVASLRRAREATTLTSKESAALSAAVSPAEELRARLEQIGREGQAANANLEAIGMQRRSAPGEVRVTHEPLPGSAANDNVETPLQPVARAAEEVLEEQAKVAVGAEGHEPVPWAKEESPYLVEASSAGGRGKPSTGKVMPPASRGGASKNSGSTGGGGSRPRTPPARHERIASQPGATGKRGTWTEAMHKAARNAWKEFMPERYWIDMTGAPESAARTSQGWQRDSEWFWKGFHKRFKDEWWFSKTNQEWAKLGQPCEIDDLWIKNFPEQEYFLGDLLVHHHVESGPFAAAIPRAFHQVLHGPLHYVDIFNR